MLNVYQSIKYLLLTFLFVSEANSAIGEDQKAPEKHFLQIYIKNFIQIRYPTFALLSRCGVNEPAVHEVDKMTCTLSEYN